MSQATLSASFEWVDLGEILLDDLGKPQFPRAPQRPGLYKFEFLNGDIRSVYIGETDRLDRRFQHYRTPGPTQQTNIRLNALITETLRASGTKVTVQILTDGALIMLNSESTAADLTRKMVRVLLEQAALYRTDMLGLKIVNA